MRAINYFFSALFFLSATLGSFAQDLSYYLPTGYTYNPAIPKPKDIIYHEVGQWHVTHDRLVNYMKALSVAAPDRIKLETMGYTYEGRPQVLLIITSPANHRNLEKIRLQHLQLSDQATAATAVLDDMPAVVWIGHSIHGNEPSGANASLLTAYLLAAAQGSYIDNLLSNTVILFDPSFNPDGLQRFSTWANQHKSKNLVADPNSREFNEVWPGGRFNHYWFDLNRDWLPAVHVESQNRLRWFHWWKPNLLTDHHEQGTNATYFFQPGVPSRVNPLTPGKNQELTAALAKYHARVLDSIGSFYFTKEGYDDFYYGKGSTYPDINGAVGILFEQASSRGHLQESVNGLLSFPATIRNQFNTALSTLEGALALRKDFLAYQRDFYKQVPARAAVHPVKAYVVGAPKDQARIREFATLLNRHQIKIYPLPTSLADADFQKESAFVVPLDQPQHSLIRTIFERTSDYKDSLFYDITAWTLSLAMGLQTKELTSLPASLGAPLQLNEKTILDNGVIADLSIGSSTYALLVEWDHLYAPAALNQLLQKGVMVKVATQPFEIAVGGASRRFEYGTLLIPALQAGMGKAELERFLNGLIEKYRMVVYAVGTGYASSGVDLGSAKFMTLEKPSVALLTGSGVNATDAGEVWHLLDQRMDIAASHLEPASVKRIDLSRYNAIIMVGGNYSELDKDKIKSWVQQGGTLVVLEEAINWAVQSGISNATFKRVKSATDSTQFRAYETRDEVAGAQQVRGAILGATYDPSHPLAFGYHQKEVSLFKANRIFMEKSKNPYQTPFVYGKQPMQSGWMSKENREAAAGSAAVTVSSLGSGRVINIADNPNFRAYWLGGSKLFLNALFFGQLIDVGGARNWEE
ncbi:MAG: zinc carboxypeptidase [Sphingomonadales bacterium]|nr:zinc carboxypeptidase [Sphingomonadales bacterium]